MSLKRVKFFLTIGLVLGTFLFPTISTGQISTRELAGGDLNAIQTAVPFLIIAPDSRAGAMGDAGVATTADINSQHWNVAKYPFIEGNGGFSLTYTPWLRNLIADINLAYLSGYYRIDDNQVLSSSLRYFSLGEITFTDENGGLIDKRSPSEFALDAGYSFLLSEHLSGGIAFRFIYTDITANIDEDLKAGLSFAADLGIYYENDLALGGNDAKYALGASITNMGTPISYSDDATTSPIPTNLRLGGRFDYALDQYNSISFTMDFNKLLVPTPPIMEDDSVLYGKEAPSSVLLGMVQSFYDAPGLEFTDGSRSVFLEEMYEIAISTGVEYWYRNQFALRAGYFNESAIKGNRKYFTVGVGLKLNVFNLDFSYLVPTNGINSPLANTLRITLGFDFEDFNL